MRRQKAQGEDEMEGVENGASKPIDVNGRPDTDNDELIAIKLTSEWADEDESAVSTPI